MDHTIKGLADMLGVEPEELSPEELASCSDGPRPKITAVPATMPKMARRALDLLVKNADKPWTPASEVVFNRGHHLVHINRNKLDPNKTIRDQDGRVVDSDYHVADELLIEFADPEWIADVLERAVAFMRLDRKGNPEPCDIPRGLVARAIKIKTYWKFPKLLGTVECPTMRRDGSILQEPGYDVRSRLYFDPHGVTFPKVFDRPTRRQALRALTMLKAILSDFPFADEDGIEGLSLAVALACLLTAVVRRMLPTAPMFGWDANEVESGKTLAAQLGPILMTGRRTAARPFSHDEYQRGAAIAAALDGGDASILFDNVDTPLAGHNLDMVITEEIYKTRRFKSNSGADQIEAFTNALLQATGNKLKAAGDMSGSRVLIAKIVPEQVLSARTFKHPDLAAYVMAKRPKLVWAALTILRAYVVAGKPERSPHFRLTEWRKLVADALIWLGEVDPCRSVARVQDADPVRETQRAVMREWLARFNVGQHVKASAIMPADDLRQAVADAVNVDIAKLTPRRAAEYFKDMIGVRLDGHKLVGAADAHRTWTFAAVRISKQKHVKQSEPWD